jgi:NAD+ kinase
MKIAIFGHQFDETSDEFINKMFNILFKKNVEIIINKTFFDFLSKFYSINLSKIETYTTHTEITKDIDFVISIGGDGTFLETVSYVRDKNIPIVGVNSGRLGFLANIAKSEIENAITKLLNHEYKIEERAVIELDTNKTLFKDFNFGLNDFTIQKSYSSSMIEVKVLIDGEYLNTYLSDGLIFSTPTGSTAYNLSAGGPIVVPNSSNFIITPITPHNLTTRPIVLSDSKEITITVAGRSRQFLASLDYKSETFSENLVLKIKKANFNIKVIKLEGQDFYQTIRDKLMWGVDKRISN